MSADSIGKLARRYHRLRQDHEHEPAALLVAFTMEAVAIAHWLGMTPEAFMATFDEAFRKMDGAKIPGFARPTIVGKAGGS